MSDSRFDFDLAVVGGGSGGYAAARSAASAGLKTVVIEGAAEVGGLCILRGCMPTKALLYAAEVRHLAQQAGIWGIQAGAVDHEFARVMARKNALIKAFADYRIEQLSAGTFEFIRAQARFLDSHSLGLSTGQTLTAGHVVVSTGSVVAEAPLPQLKAAGFLDSDRAMTLERLPESIIVLGGGAVAVEFAQFFSRFGVKTTLVQRSAQLLKEIDADAAEALIEAFRSEGMMVHTGTRLIDADRKGGLKRVAFEQAGRTEAIEAEEIFLALGRTPNTSALALDNAGVATQGARVVTDARMRTSVPHIYAAGDCTGPHEIVHIAIQQGEVAAHNIAWPDRPKEMDYRLLTSVVFTEPQVACVGLSEKEARARAIPFRAARYPFGDHGKALIMEARHGFVKLLADPNSGEILGGCCVGPVGGELIHEIIAAMHKRMTVHELAAMPHYHPTLAEIWTYPAEELAGQIRV